MRDPMDDVLWNGALIHMVGLGGVSAGWYVWTDYGEVELPFSFESRSPERQRVMIDAAIAKAKAAYLATD